MRSRQTRRPGLAFAGYLASLLVATACSSRTSAPPPPAPVQPGVFEAATTLADGTLLALQSGEDGRAYALLRAPNGQLQLASYGDDIPPGSTSLDDLAWRGPEDVGIANPGTAAVRVDATGRVVVAAIDAAGQILLVERVPGAAFTTPVQIAGSAYGDLDLAVSPTSHVAIAWASTQNGFVRMVIPGLGLGPLHALPLTFPHVWLRPAGDGVTVSSFGQNNGLLTWSERWCLDSLGGLSVCDPRPGTPGQRPSMNKAWFGADERIVVMYTVFGYWGAPEPEYEVRVDEVVPGGAWARQSPSLRGLMDGLIATDLAGSRTGRVFFAATSAGGTRAWVREASGAPWVASRLDTAAVLPSNNPLDFGLGLAAGVTNAGSCVLVWTAREGLAGGPVKLFAADQPVGGAWSQPRAISGELEQGLFGTGTKPAVAAVGDTSAIIVWTHVGHVFTAEYR